MATPVLDLSRSFSRLGKPPTSGIDRVERAYLNEVIRRDGWGVIHTPRGYLVYEPDKLARLPDYLDRVGSDGADLAGTLRALASQKAQTLSVRKFMWRMPKGLAYVNVGHMNLNAPTMRAIAEMPDHRKIVMIHDTFPLDYPEHHREVERAKFGELLSVTIDFAHHIIASSYFEEINGPKNDQTNTRKALAELETLRSRYPDSKYAREAGNRIRIARDNLAANEMEVGRYYLKRRNYTAAVNRFKVVARDYQDTKHIEEALMRLTETYMALGIRNEAQNAAAILGYNFPNSPWYKDAYDLLQSDGLAPRRDTGSWLSQAWQNIKLPDIGL